MIHIYNFKKQFVELVSSGRKRQTIRADRKDGRVPKPGDILRLYSGLMHKITKIIYETKDFKVARVIISHGGIFWYNDGHRGWFLSDKEKAEISIADGFLGFIAFYGFILDNYGVPFSGHLISW